MAADESWPLMLNKKIKAKWWKMKIGKFKILFARRLAMAVYPIGEISKRETGRNRSGYRKECGIETEDMLLNLPRRPDEFMQCRYLRLKLVSYSRSLNLLHSILCFRSVINWSVGHFSNRTIYATRLDC